MKRIIFILALLLPISIFAQDYRLFERIANDEYGTHYCEHSITTNGNIILVEQCLEYDNGWVAKGINILKVNSQAELIDSTFVAFTDYTSFSMLFENPHENDNYIFADFVYNQEEGISYYKGIMFDDDLNITQQINVPVDIEQFRGYNYRYFIDEISNDIIICYKIPNEYRYIYFRMDVYGEVKAYEESNLIDYEKMDMVTHPFFIYNQEPLQYGCYFRNCIYEGNLVIYNGSISMVILDENMNLLDLKRMHSFEGTSFFNGSVQIKGLRDNTILIAAPVSRANSFYMQLTKFDQDLNQLDYYRSSPIGSVDELKNDAIVECDDGSIYLMWTGEDRDSTPWRYWFEIARFNNELDLLWENHIEVTNPLFPIIYSASELDEGNMAACGAGSLNDPNVSDYTTVAYIFNNNGVSVSELSSSDNPFTLYPNPAGDNVSVRFAEGAGCEMVEIYSLDGRRCHAQNFNLESIDLSGLSSGVYMMKVVMNNGEVFTEKIAVK